MGCPPADVGIEWSKKHKEIRRKRMRKDNTK
jgi:hypothetical protein